MEERVFMASFWVILTNWLRCFAEVHPVLEQYTSECCTKVSLFVAGSYPETANARTCRLSAARSSSGVGSMTIRLGLCSSGSTTRSSQSSLLGTIAHEDATTVARRGILASRSASVEALIDAAISEVRNGWSGPRTRGARGFDPDWLVSLASNVKRRVEVN